MKRVAIYLRVSASGVRAASVRTIISPKGSRLMTDYDTRRLNDIRDGVLYILAMALSTNIFLALILWRLW